MANEDPDDTTGTGGDGTDGGGSDSTGQDGSGTADDAGAQGGANDGKPDEDKVAKSEADRLRERMRAADQRASKAEAELRQLKDKDLPALEKANRDLTEAQAKITKLEEELQHQRIANAFLSDNEFEWHKPDQAMRLADLSKVDIDDAGKVTGLKDALRALAKDSPHLVKPKKAADEDDKGGSGGGGGDASGRGNATPPVNGGAGNNNAALATAEKLRRFPALRTRGSS